MSGLLPGSVQYSVNFSPSVVFIFPGPQEWFFSALVLGLSNKPILQKFDVMKELALLL